MALLTLFRMGHFGAAHGWWTKRPPPYNLSHNTYPAMTQKKYKSRDTLLESCWHQHFFIGNQQLLLSQEIQI